MAVQLVSVGVTLPSVGVSLLSSVAPFPWSGESLYGVGVSLTSGVISSGSTTATSSGVMSLQFNFSSNSGMLCLLVGTV